MTSAAYAADFNEVKEVGSATGSVRTPEQTTTTAVHRGDHPPASQFLAA